MKDQLSKIYNLRHITRYSNVERVRDESVAEHSFFVAAIVLELYKEYDFNLGYALRMAICHDYPEVYVDDVSHKVKADYPEVAKSLKRAEKEAIKSFSPIVIESYLSFEEGDSIESKIVKLADIIQVKQYCESEIRLGNTGYIKTVLLESMSLEIELREYINHSNTLELDTMQNSIKR